MADDDEEMPVQRVHFKTARRPRSPSSCAARRASRKRLHSTSRRRSPRRRRTAPPSQRQQLAQKRVEPPAPDACCAWVLVRRCLRKRRARPEPSAQLTASLDMDRVDTAQGGWPAAVHIVPTTLTAPEGSSLESFVLTQPREPSSLLPARWRVTPHKLDPPGRGRRGHAVHHPARHEDLQQRNRSGRAVALDGGELAALVGSSRADAGDRASSNSLRPSVARAPTWRERALAEHEGMRGDAC